MGRTPNKDSVVESIIDEIAEEKGIDRRVVSHVIMGFYKQVKNVIEKADVNDPSTFLSVTIPGFGRISPMSMRRIKVAKMRSDRLKNNLLAKKKHPNNEDGGE